MRHTAEEQSYIFATGTNSVDVNNAMLTLESERDMYPYSYMEPAELRAAVKKYAGFHIEEGSEDEAELYQLWSEHVKSFNEDARLSGYNPYINKDITDVRTALSALRPEVGRIVLPQDIRFSRKCYETVKKMLLVAGGRYLKNTIIFDDDVDTEDLVQRLLNGETVNKKKKFQQFYTPAELAERMRQLACITDADLILEPSAGRAGLLAGIPLQQIHCCELDPKNQQYLRDRGYQVVAADFLEYTPDCEYDVILANPPFTKNQDIRHIQHMYSMLAHGGRLVSLASTSWVHGTQKLQQEFTTWLKVVGASAQELPAGTFKTSGTGVAAVLIQIRK